MKQILRLPPNYNSHRIRVLSSAREQLNNAFFFLFSPITNTTPCFFQPLPTVLQHLRCGRLRQQRLFDTADNGHLAEQQADGRTLLATERALLLNFVAYLHSFNVRVS